MGLRFSLKERIIHRLFCNNFVFEGCIGHKDKYHDEDMRRIGQTLYNIYGLLNATGASITLRDNGDGHFSSSIELERTLDEAWKQVRELHVR